MGDRSSAGGQIRQDVAGRIRLDQANGRLVVVDASKNIIAELGFDENGRNSFRMVPVGKDVRTAAAKEFIVDSTKQTLTIANSDKIKVSRAASTDQGFSDVATGVLGAPMFLATVRNPAGSPSFSQQTPFPVFATSGTDSGKIITNKRALYDPSTGVVRFFVESTTINPAHATAETWEFQYFLLYQNIPS